MKKTLLSFLGLFLIVTMVFSTASAADGCIAPEAAVEAALTHAGIQAQDATIVRVKLDKDDGLLHYEVEFYAGNKEYDYDIDATTGKVAGFDSETETPRLPMEKADGLISEDAAKAAAFAHAGIDGASATLALAQLGYDDGRWEYEIEFFIGGTEYDYEIDAATGDVLSFDQDMESAAPPRETVSGDIGADRAKEIALADAGLTADSVRGLEADRERDNGVTLYEVEFKAGGKEYSYEIDAATGAILERKAEKDD